MERGSEASASATTVNTGPSRQASLSPARQYVYALGRVEPQYPDQGTEKEMAQLLGRSDASGLTDRRAIYDVLKERENRYLARRLCWLFRVEGIETFLLEPRDTLDVELLIKSIRPVTKGGDVDALIGELGPISDNYACGNLGLPIVFFDDIYSFDVDYLMSAMPSLEDKDDDSSKEIAEELFMRIQQIADNAGATDDHRAINYLALRYPAIYAQAIEAYGDNSGLVSIDVVPSRLSGARKIVDVVFSFRNRATDVNSDFFVRVDVSDLFPFIVSKLSPYFRR